MSFFVRGHKRDTASDRYMNTFLGAAIRWRAGSEIPYYINPETYSELTPDEIHNSVKQALSHWESELDSSVTFKFCGYTTDIYDTFFNDAMNVIYFDPLLDFPDESALAITSIQHKRSGEITGFDLALNDYFYEFKSPGEAVAETTEPGAPYEASLESILTHELGHALGLKDLYDDRFRQSAMYYASDGAKPAQLAKGDKKAIDFYYA
jgi:hypothetical protein